MQHHHKLGGMVDADVSANASFLQGTEQLKRIAVSEITTMTADSINKLLAGFQHVSMAICASKAAGKAGAAVASAPQFTNHSVLGVC